MNTVGSRCYRGNPVSNAHNPNYDDVYEFDIYSLQGDVIVVLWEYHSVRNNVPLGQVIIPISQLCSNRNMLHTQGFSSVSGWFEVFPFNKPNRYNRGGQYRPFTPGMPSLTGYGLDKPEKTIGYLKLDITIVLEQSLLRTIVSNPYCHRRLPPMSDVQEDDAGIASVFIAKDSVKRAMLLMKNPPLIETFHLVIRWETKWYYSFGFLYLHSYTCLLAPIWQYPFLILFAFMALGLIAREVCESEDAQLYIDRSEENPDTESGAANGADSSAPSKANNAVASSSGASNAKGIASGSSNNSSGNTSVDKKESLSEKLRSIKNTAVSIERMVVDTSATIEKMNNLVIWSDPLVTGAFMFFLFCIAVVASIMLVFIPPNFFIFAIGVAMFIPDDDMKQWSYNVKLLMQDVKIFLMKKGLIKQDAELAKSTTAAYFQGLKLLSVDKHLHKIRGHEYSGFAYSKIWPLSTSTLSNQRSKSIVNASVESGFSEGGEKGERGGHARRTSSHYTARWCEIWRNPPLLKIAAATLNIADPQGGEVPSGGKDRDRDSKGGGVADNAGAAKWEQDSCYLCSLSNASVVYL